MTKQVRKHMTPLDVGLAINGRKMGLSLDALSEIFHRDRNTIIRLFKRHAVKPIRKSKKEYIQCPKKTQR